MKVKIRYNTNYPERSPKKWRVIVNDVERLADEVEIKCSSYTSEDSMVIDGKEVKKFHISCTPHKLHEEKKLLNTKIILS